jgi:hypothetical protein
MRTSRSSNSVELQRGFNARSNVRSVLRSLAAVRRFCTLTITQVLEGLKLIFRTDPVEFGRQPVTLAIYLWFWAK